MFNTSLRRAHPVDRGRPDRPHPGSPRIRSAGLVGRHEDRRVPGEFVSRHLDRLVIRKSVVLIFSDGLDRGDSRSLAGAMRAIRARAGRVIWLNPLAGDARYEPTARAMAAARPFVDRLPPAHDLESLERLLPAGWPEGAIRNHGNGDRKAFVVKATPDATVWAFLTDPVRWRSCLPGAAITEKSTNRRYAGTITSKSDR